MNHPLMSALAISAVVHISWWAAIPIMVRPQPWPTTPSVDVSFVGAILDASALSTPEEPPLILHAAPLVPLAPEDLPDRAPTIRPRPDPDMMNVIAWETFWHRVWKDERPRQDPLPGVWAQPQSVSLQPSSWGPFILLEGTLAERALLIGPDPGQPPYPSWAQGSHVVFHAVLRIEADDRGWVTAVDLVQSSGIPALDQKGAQALRACRFEPRASPSRLWWGLVGMTVAPSESSSQPQGSGR